MDTISELLRYVLDQPAAFIGVAAGLLGIYYLLNRKSRLTREAEARIEQLQRERGDYYKTLRPPR